jgi:P-type Ca2+ transporter type 2C
MTIQRVVTASGEVEVTGSGYRPEGELRSDGKPLAEGPLLDEVRWVLVAGSLANDAVLREELGHWTVEGDATEAAFLVAEGEVSGLDRDPPRAVRARRRDPVHLRAQAHDTLQADALDADIDVVTKGAPDVLLERCTAERVAGEVRPLTAARRAEILATVDRLAGLALRTPRGRLSRDGAAGRGRAGRA